LFLKLNVKSTDNQRSTKCKNALISLESNDY